MKRNEKNVQPGKVKSKRSETLKQKIHRHLKDKNNIITDEDISSTVVGENEGQESPTIIQPSGPIKEPVVKQAEKFPVEKKSTPWDILSED